MKVSFGGIEITGPVAPSQMQEIARFNTELTEGLIRYSYETSTAQRFIWQMSWSSMTSAEKTALDTFFRATAKGPVNQFDYVHTDGSAWRARFLDLVLKWTRSGSAFAVSISMEVIPQ